MERTPFHRRTLHLLGPLDWDCLPERNLTRDWGQTTIPQTALIAALLIQLNEGLRSMSALTLGRYDEARAALEESVSLSKSVGDRWGLGFAYQGLGIVVQAQGKHIQAVNLFRKGPDTLTELGARQHVARVLAEMGGSIFALGNDPEAGRVWRESLRIATETRGTFVALEAMVGLARLQAKRGDIEQALEWLLIVLNHPASVQETKNHAEQLRIESEAQLTRPQVEAAEARVQVRTFEAAVDEVLKQAELT